MQRILILSLLFVLLAFFSSSPLFADDEISVTGTVPPKVTDFQFEFATTDNTHEKRQDERFTYEITYGASSSAGITTATTIQANWNDAKAIDGNRIVEYEIGSATKAYGNTSPVVDLVNRTITWNIANFPPGSIDRKVQFQMKTLGIYTGPNRESFVTTATMNNQFVTLPQQSLIRHYRYVKLPDPTPTIPTMTTLTPTPTQSPTTPITITDIALTGITDETVSINATVTTDARLQLRYGTAANNLSQAITIAAAQKSGNRLSLEGLRPATTYYFQLIATDDSRSTTSDIFTFKTAQISNPPTGEDNVVIITSNGSILISDVKEKDREGSAIALVTTDTPYEITYRVRNQISLKAIEAVMRQTGSGNTLSKVLGTNEHVIEMQEKEPLVYVAKLRTDITGTFDIFVRMQDTNGNIVEEKIAATKIMPLISVYDKEINQPVADARIFTSFYNTKTKQFEPLFPLTFENIQNPIYTNQFGTAKLLLPPGKYRVHVSGFGYDERTVEFTLGTKPGEDFPRILLTKNTANLINYLQYYSNALTDIFLTIQTAVASLAFSVRFFNLMATFILILAIVTTILFFHLRTRVSPWHLLPYLIHHFKELFHKHSIRRFCATIADETGRKISDARIATVDGATGDVITTFTSNQNGICYVLNPEQETKLKLLITKEGYAPKTVAIESDFDVSDRGLSIILRKGHKPSNLGKLWEVLQHVGGLFFEISLFGSIALELLFFSLFGFTKTLPFFILSLGTLLLWIFYQREKQARKIFKKP